MQLLDCVQRGRLLSHEMATLICCGDPANTTVDNFDHRVREKRRYKKAFRLLICYLKIFYLFFIFEDKV